MAELTGNEEPSSCTRHAKSIPSEARIAACVRPAHVGKPQRSIRGKRDPEGVYKQRQQLTIQLNTESCIIR